MSQIPTTKDAAGRGEILLRARGLSKSYGGLRAVNDASLDLYPGEVVALVGDNGAGKSTFVKMLSGVIAPDAGTLALHGGEVRFSFADAGARSGHRDAASEPGAGGRVQCPRKHLSRPRAEHALARHRAGAGQGDHAQPHTWVSCSASA